MRARSLAQHMRSTTPVLEALPAEVTESVFTWEGSPAVDSGAYANVKSILGVEDVDPYSAQTYDHASLVILAMAAGGDVTGDTVRANIRNISQGDGQMVESAVDGLAALDGGINYSGASGSLRLRRDRRTLPARSSCSSRSPAVHPLTISAFERTSRSPGRPAKVVAR